jgi:hypothetical protein
MWKLFVLTFLNLSSAWACFAPPESAKLPIEEMVKLNDNIYLAEAVKVSKTAKISAPTSNIFTFKVVETLKGKAVSTMKIEALQAKGDRKVDDYNGHKDEAFWNNSTGRLINDPSCQVLPTFTKGTRYLIFPLQPYTYKSLEIIKSDDDMFLKKVRELVASSKKTEEK